MNHDEDDTKRRDEGSFVRQEDAPSQLERQAARERDAKGIPSPREPAVPRSRVKKGSVAGDFPAASPRASAVDDRAASDNPPAAPPAGPGDRTARERQLSEPGAAFTDDTREPQTALRDVEGMSAEADLSTRGEGGSRQPEDVASTGLAEQRQRLGLERKRKSADRSPESSGQNREPRH